MFKSSFQKIIDSLKIEFIQASIMQAIKSVTVKGETHPNNRLVILHKGKITIKTHDNEMILYPNRIYFLPAGTIADITYGAYPIALLTKGETGKDINNYIKPIQSGTALTGTDIISIIDFNVKAYNSIDFFSFLGMPFFEIEGSDEMDNTIKKIIEENKQDNLGKHQLLNAFLVKFIVMLLRHIIDKKMFLQKISLKIDALMDRRLVDIFAYVNSHIKEDLSNANVAIQVGLSKEYVGQFFKKITNMNLQEYIKTMRVNKAVELITTTNMKIQDVSKEVGINDFAYFCRIFKTAIGSTAKQIQQRSIYNLRAKLSNHPMELSPVRKDLEPKFFKK